MDRINYREALANDVTDLQLLAMGKPLLRQQVAELMGGIEDAGDVADDLWADALNGVAEAIYEAEFDAEPEGGQRAMLAQIVAWLEDIETFAGATIEGLTLSWLLDTGCGRVVFDDVTYTLMQDAYADNYGTAGLVHYFAQAIDNAGNEYLVFWDTKESWDLACERETLSRETHLDDEDAARLEELEAMVLPDVNDESNACYWDSPDGVMRL